MNNETVSHANDHSGAQGVQPTDDSAVVTNIEAAGGVPAGTRLLSLPDAAEKAGVVVTKIVDMLRNKQLIAVRIHDVRYIPEVFFNETGEVNKFVPGVIALLSDGGYSNAEILDYLFTEDDSLPGRPSDALHGHLAREVMRRAQAMAF